MVFYIFLCLLQKTNPGELVVTSVTTYQKFQGSNFSHGAPRESG